MADIRLTQPRTGLIWIWSVGLALVGLLLWGSKFVLGDATEGARAVGAAAGFGDERAPLIPMPAEPFTEVDPLETRDLGRLVGISGVLENGPRAGSKDDRRWQTCVPAPARAGGSDAQISFPRPTLPVDHALPERAAIVGAASVARPIAARTSASLERVTVAMMLPS